MPGMAETDGIQPISFPSWAQRTYGPAFLQLGVAMCLSSGLWNVGIGPVLYFSAWSIKTFHVEGFLCPICQPDTEIQWSIHSPRERQNHRQRSQHP